jgi:serpin B
VQSDLPRDTTPTVAPADATQLASDDTTFAVSLYKGIATDDSTNLFYSPYSISLALAMTYNGASGATAQQMAQALDFSLPVARLNAALDAVDLALATRKNAIDGNGQPVKGFELNVADSLWADKTLTLAQPFVDALGQNYGAGIRVVDFLDQPDPSRVAINGWVSSQTNAKIPDLIPQGDIDSTTRLVLVNAIYFDAAWASPFAPSATHAEPFTHIDGGTVSENAMSQVLEANYVQGTGWQAVELPYVGEQTSMVVIVPDAGNFATVESGLSTSFVQSTFASLEIASVTLTLPKFQIQGATISLSQELQALGMVDAFNPSTADFSNMSAQPLYVSNVVHQAFVTVDELGTEAAAATAVVMDGLAVPSQQITLDVNRPFLFFIRDIPTNTVLFVGRVVDPTT